MGLITAFRKRSTEFVLHHALPCSEKGSQSSSLQRKGSRVFRETVSLPLPLPPFLQDEDHAAILLCKIF